MSDPTLKRWKTKEWTYYPANDTDISRTFRRIRREQKEAEAAKKPASNVKALTKKGAK